MRYKVGQLVMNNKLGLGKVLEAYGDNVTCFFKDQSENPRIINVAVVPMEIPKEQSDPWFDEGNMARHRNKTAPVKKTRAKRQTGTATPA